MEQLAYLARKLDSIQEGSRSLLDNTMLMHCSSMMGEPNTTTINFQSILLGSAGGQIKTGRVVDCSESSERQLCRLFLSLMKNGSSSRNLR